MQHARRLVRAKWVGIRVWVTWIFINIKAGLHLRYNLVRMIKGRLLYIFVYNVVVLCFMHHNKSIKSHNKCFHLAGTWSILRVTLRLTLSDYFGV